MEQKHESRVVMCREDGDEEDEEGTERLVSCLFEKLLVMLLNGLNKWE